MLVAFEQAITQLNPRTDAPTIAKLARIRLEWRTLTYATTTSPEYTVLMQHLLWNLFKQASETAKCLPLTPPCVRAMQKKANSFLFSISESASDRATAVKHIIDLLMHIDRAIIKLDITFANEKSVETHISIAEIHQLMHTISQDIAAHSILYTKHDRQEILRVLRARQMVIKEMLKETMGIRSKDNCIDQKTHPLLYFIIGIGTCSLCMLLLALASIECQEAVVLLHLPSQEQLYANINVLHQKLITA